MGGTTFFLSCFGSPYFDSGAIIREDLKSHVYTRVRPPWVALGSQRSAPPSFPQCTSKYLARGGTCRCSEQRTLQMYPSATVTPPFGLNTPEGGSLSFVKFNCHITASIMYVFPPPSSHICCCGLQLLNDFSHACFEPFAPGLLITLSDNETHGLFKLNVGLYFAEIFSLTF